MKYLIVTFLLLIVISSFTAPTLANESSPCKSDRKGYCMRLSDEDSFQSKQEKRASSLLAVAFPGLEFLESYGVTWDSKIGDTLSALYNFGVGIAGVSAFAVFVYGGFMYMTAAGGGRASQAKKLMENAVYGLVLVATSYLILYIINPDFTYRLKLEQLTPIQAPKPKY